MRIAKGTYCLENRHLVLDLTADLDLADGVLLYLCGDNGLGKTSFLEEVLIPTLQDDGLPYLYLGQDMGIQLYTLKASLAVAGHGLRDFDEQQLIELWMQEGRSACVFVLDEFDKYYPDYGIIWKHSAGFIKTYVIVSHTGAARLQAPADISQGHRVSFHLDGYDGTVKKVRVDQERMW